MIVRITRYDTPCGRMVIGENKGALLFCDWTSHEPNHSLTLSQRRLKRLANAVFCEEDSEVLEKTKIQLKEYFSASRMIFRLPIRLYGTDFQKDVWTALSNIPFGITVSYADIARRLHRPDSVRAVANAVGANPLSIIVPCHRIIGSDGRLTGYAGGLDIKNFLLSIECPVFFTPINNYNKYDWIRGRGNADCHEG